jgi:hypothetical protein
MYHANVTLRAAAASLALFGCDQEAETGMAAANAAAASETASQTASTDHSDPLASAMAAAPTSIGSKASIVQAQADGSMKMLRQGSNGWTCMPDNPQTPGHDPMCMDANGLKWAQAWMAHKDPPTGAVGLMYMLEGGSDASNRNPFATRPNDGQWVETGPHIMVVGSKEILAGYPADDKPDTRAPYVMFAGTPYAHLMIPIGNS